MKALIVQAGGGFYGVNVRLITDEEAVGIADKLNKLGTANSDESVTVLGIGGVADEGATVWIQEVEPGKSFGFDTGMWNEAEKLIDVLTGK